MNTMYKVHITLYYASLTCIYVFAHNFLNIQQIINPKSFQKLRVRAFQPYLCMLKMSDISDVSDISNIADML